MRATLTVLILVVFSLIMGGSYAFAQNSYFKDGAYESSSVSDLKSHVQILLEENGKLKTEYEALRKEFIELLKEKTKYKREFKGINLGLWETSKRQDQQEQMLGNLERDVDMMRSEALYSEHKNVDLGDEIENMDALQTLRRLRLADLQFQQRELQMDLQWQEVVSENKNSQQREELDDFRKDIIVNIERTKELNHLITELQQQLERYPLKMEQLQSENRTFKEQIEALEQKKHFKIKENNILKDKKLLTIKRSEPELKRKEYEKEKLEMRIRQLEQETHLMREMEDFVLDEKADDMANSAQSE